MVKQLGRIRLRLKNSMCYVHVHLPEWLEEVDVLYPFQKDPLQQASTLPHHARARYTTYSNHAFQLPIIRSSSESTSILPMPVIICVQNHALECLDTNDLKANVSAFSRVPPVAVASFWHITVVSVATFSDFPPWVVGRLCLTLSRMRWVPVNMGSQPIPRFRTAPVFLVIKFDAFT